MIKNLVIVVDDVQVCHDFIKLLFGSYTNYEIISAYSANNALNIIQKHYNNIALIILDLTLPDISGVELFKILYADDNLKNIPILFQSGFNVDLNNEINISLRDNLKIDFLAKPFTKEKLFIKITNLLGDNWLNINKQIKKTKLLKKIKQNAK